MAKYHRVKDGEAVRPKMSGHKLCCCDCGLTHRVHFRIFGKRIEFKAYRDNRATGQVRRGMKKAK